MKLQCNLYVSITYVSTKSVQVNHQKREGSEKPPVERRDKSITVLITTNIIKLNAHAKKITAENLRFQ